ncbi:hypothetical protein GCM10010515_07210 [Streptomyces fructofermentans]|uniref:Uncharacterized protein n=1 Tax=Streptomyces fructofermentans TaxID=152141 RepID=A0A918K408_9ACTN|nr:hypothetical protein GCM10010515_07210 [Streptomyces fructofermentans]
MFGNMWRSGRSVAVRAGDGRRHDGRRHSAGRGGVTYAARDSGTSTIRGGHTLRRAHRRAGASRGTPALPDPRAVRQTATPSISKVCTEPAAKGTLRLLPFR